MYLKNERGKWILKTNICKNGGRFVIVLDFDGIITNPHSMKSETFKRYGYDIKPAHTSRGYIINALKLKRKFYEKISYEVNIKNLDSVPLEKNSKEVIDKLYRDKRFLVFIVTSRRENEIKPVLRYLDKHQININGLFNTNRESKSKILKKLKPDIFVDDTISKIYNILSSTVKKELSNCTFILYGNITNKEDSQLKFNVIRVDGSWEELESIIRRKFRNSQSFTLSSTSGHFIAK